MWPFGMRWPGDTQKWALDDGLPRMSRQARANGTVSHPSFRFIAMLSAYSKVQCIVVPKGIDIQESGAACDETEYVLGKYGP